MSLNFGVSVVDGALHIDGYPDAKRLVALNSRNAHRMADLRLHESALKVADSGMQEFFGLRQPFPNAAELALVGAATLFFSCFGVNQATAPLDPKKTFKGEVGALECFFFWKAIRDKHFVHNENMMTFPTTAGVLGLYDEPQDVLSLNVSMWLSTDDDHCRLLGQLIAFTLNKVRQQAEELKQLVVTELRALPAEHRARLPDVVFNQPIPEDAYKTRIRKRS